MSPQEMFAEAIRARHNVAWNKPNEIPEEKTVGLCVSSFCEWDGNQIVLAFLQALEDANQHSTVRELIPVLETNYDLSSFKNDSRNP